MVKLYCKFPVVLLLLALSAFLSASAENVTTSIIAEVLRQFKAKNVIVSPLLLSEGLWQLYLGAEGTTSEEFAKVLDLHGPTKNDAIRYYSTWHKSLEPPKGVTLLKGNRLYLANDINILPAYQQQINDIFNSKVEKVDFGDSKTTVSNINGWVAKQTNNKITKLIDQTDAQTRMMLLSALYFHGKWKNKFDEKNTAKGPFYIPQKTGDPRTVQVDFMVRTKYDGYRYSEKLDAHCLSLAYANSNVSMIILLPKEVDGLDKLVQNLEKVDTKEFQTEERFLSISMPKFKLETETELIPALQNLGLQQLFNNANLSGMTDASNLLVSSVLQKGVIEVDEEGTTATAAQVIGVSTFSTLPHYEVNHPFVFLIKDAERIYFAGQVINP